MTKTIESILNEKQELEASIKSTTYALRDVLCQTDDIVKDLTIVGIEERLMRRQELLNAYDTWSEACSKYKNFMNQEVDIKG
jgi:hypothetical protein